MDVIIINVEVFGRRYKLQHPGAREWLKLKQVMYKPKDDSLDLIVVLDYFFDHCCFPEVGEKLSIDSFGASAESMIELEAWGLIAPRFLRGVISDGYIYPDDDSGKSEDMDAGYYRKQS
jgi:hypothetical protein